MTTKPALTTSPDRSRPLPPSMTVRDALHSYLAENGFDTAAYTADTFEIEPFGRTYSFPNSADRKKAIPLHDLHHVATGYGTNLVGEAEVGMWELRAGCRTPVVYLLNTIAMSGGLFLAPLRMWRTFRDARRSLSLYRQPHEYEELLNLTLGELRARMGIPAEGLAREPRRLHDSAPVPAVA